MAKTKTEAAGPANKGLQIVSRRASFWRCGMQFTSEPRVLPLDTLSDEQVARLRDETQLVVTDVDIAPTSAKPAA